MRLDTWRRRLEFGIFRFGICFGFRIFRDNFADADKSGTCESVTEPLTVKLTAWAKAAALSGDSHLAAVLAAWTTLPEAAKVGIVAMISAYPRE